MSGTSRADVAGDGGRTSLLNDDDLDALALELLRSERLTYRVDELFTGGWFAVELPSRDGPEHDDDADEFVLLNELDVRRSAMTYLAEASRAGSTGELNRASRQASSSISSHTRAGATENATWRLWTVASIDLSQPVEQSRIRDPPAVSAGTDSAGSRPPTSSSSATYHRASSVRADAP